MLEQSYRLHNCFFLDGQSKEIVYFPEGDQEVSGAVGGNPKTFRVVIDPDNGDTLAETFQSQLQERLNENVRPNLDFDHENKKASAIPQRFFYRSGVGLMLEVEWTSAGLQAIEGRDYSYFSPSFIMDDKTGVPTGIPLAGPLGGLVNDPAFRNIPRIAASRAGDANHKPMKANTMSELVTCGLLTEVEAAKTDATSLASRRIIALKQDANDKTKIETKLTNVEAKNADLKQKIAQLKKLQQRTKQTSAEAAITEAVTAGRIAARDEVTQEFWKSAILSQGESAITQLKSLPVTEDVTQVITTFNQGEKQTEAAASFDKEVANVIKAGRAKTDAEAIELVAREMPELYENGFGFSE